MPISEGWVFPVTIVFIALLVLWRLLAIHDNNDWVNDRLRARRDLTVRHDSYLLALSRYNDLEKLANGKPEGTDRRDVDETEDRVNSAYHEVTRHEADIAEFLEWHPLFGEVTRSAFHHAPPQDGEDPRVVRIGRSRAQYLMGLLQRIDESLSQRRL